MKRLLLLFLMWGVIFSNTSLAEEIKENTEIDINNIGSVVLVIDSVNGDILDVNKSALDFYGYSKEEFLELKINDINTLTEQEFKEVMDIAKINKEDYLELKHILKNGYIKDVEVYSSEGIISGEQQLYLVVHDISDRILIQKEARTNQYIIYFCLFLLFIFIFLY
jgi:PAS domain S-box-containing protein